MIIRENLVHKKKGEMALVTWIKRRITRNQNCVALFEGPTGSGKSYACLSLAQKIDAEFNAKEQIVFYLSDFMKLINSEDFQKKKWKIVIFEELQVSASNRNWQSAMNKMLNYVLSTFRNQNIILFFNSPYRDFLDSQSMKLLHLIIEMRGINRKEKKATIKPLIQQYNPKVRKTYEHSLLVVGSNGKAKKLGLTSLYKATDEAIEIYEAKKKKFTDDLNKEILAQAQELEQKEKKILDDTKEEPIHMLKPDELMIYEYIKDHPDKLQKDYAKELNYHGGKLSVTIKRIEKKGINVKKYIGKPAFNGFQRKSHTNTAKNPLNSTSETSYEQ